jgi:signal peptidase II
MRHLTLTAILTFALDQILKWFVVIRLDLRNLGEMDVFAPFLVFRMAWNRGVNFGLLSSHDQLTRWGLILLALGITAWVVWWVRREGAPRGMAISAGLLAGGALGNVVDRVIYGAVADFLNMSCCGIDNPFSFNVADVAIFAGALGLVLFTPKKPDGKPPRGTRKTA